jgi:uncharacterized protein YpiB (UPF0302 family)
MKELREFPEWYVGTSIMPEEANQVTPTEERIERKKAFIAQEAQLNGLIDEALDKTDKDAFDLYTNMLKNLRENAN